MQICQENKLSNVFLTCSRISASFYWSEARYREMETLTKLKKPPVSDVLPRHINPINEHAVTAQTDFFILAEKVGEYSCGGSVFLALPTVLALILINHDLYLFRPSRKGQGVKENVLVCFLCGRCSC